MKSIRVMTMKCWMTNLIPVLMFFAMQAAHSSGCTPDQVEKMIDKGLSKNDINDLCKDAGRNSSFRRGKVKTSIPAMKVEAAPQAGNGQADFEKGKVAHESKNYPEALKRFQTSANVGHAAAQWYLGWMYESGQATGKNDYAEAMRWYRKAADQGHTDAMKSISFMYENGKGVPQDHAEGMRWLQKAAVQGDENAIKMIRSMRENEKLEGEIKELDQRMHEPLKIDESAGGLEYLKTH